MPPPQTLCCAAPILENVCMEKKHEMSGLRKQENSIYSRFHYQLPKNSLVLKERSIRK